MNSSKINEISHMISNIGKRQLEYYQFFPEYSEQLVKYFGEYLGDSTSVRLAPPTGDFDFLTVVFRPLRTNWLIVGITAN